MIKFGIIFKLKQNGFSGKLLSTLSDFLKDRNQRVSLNRQVSSWTVVNAGVPQESILDLLLYINNLADGLSSNAKLFADDTALFSVIQDVETSADKLNNNFYQINEWVLQWKMTFNTDSMKQAYEVTFGRKTRKISHPSLRFNNSIVSQTSYQKYLAIFLKTQRLRNI